MQVGMVVGFATSYPANALLIRVGIKEGVTVAGEVDAADQTIPPAITR